MKNNNWQFTTLETSRRLKELGVKQESMMYWKSKMVDINDKNNEWKLMNFGGNDFDYSAFSASELGEILPVKVWHHTRGCSVPLTILKNEIGPPSWYIEYYDCCFSEATLADAMAKMLIYLKENNLL